jgi:hypothetical protein
MDKQLLHVCAMSRLCQHSRGVPGRKAMLLKIAPAEHHQCIADPQQHVCSSAACYTSNNIQLVFVTCILLAVLRSPLTVLQGLVF